MIINDENLIPFGSGKLTQNEERALQRKGGINSGKSRSIKAREKEEWQRLLSMGMDSGETEDFESLKDAKSKNLSISAAMKVKIITMALKGDLRAYELLMKYAGAEEPEPQEMQEQTAQNGFINALFNATANIWANEVKADAANTSEKE